MAPHQENGKILLREGNTSHVVIRAGIALHAAAHWLVPEFADSKVDDVPDCPTIEQMLDTSYESRDWGSTKEFLAIERYCWQANRPFYPRVVEYLLESFKLRGCPASNWKFSSVDDFMALRLKGASSEAKFVVYLRVNGNEDGVDLRPSSRGRRQAYENGRADDSTYADRVLCQEAEAYVGESVMGVGGPHGRLAGDSEIASWWESYNVADAANVDKHLHGVCILFDTTPFNPLLNKTLEAYTLALLKGLTVNRATYGRTAVRERRLESFALEDIGSTSPIVRGGLIFGPSGNLSTTVNGCQFLMKLQNWVDRSLPVQAWIGLEESGRYFIELVHAAIAKRWSLFEFAIETHGGIGIIWDMVLRNWIPLEYYLRIAEPGPRVVQ